MDRRFVIGSLALVLVAGVTIAAVGGLLETPDLDRAEVGTETPTTGVGTEGGGAGDGTGSDGRSTPSPPFELVVDSVEPCGQTCRDVTATLENTQDRPATGVTVDTTIYAGENTEGDVAWEGSREIGTLESGESVTDTTRIELGWLDAAAIQSAGGEVTIETIVESDRERQRFLERRDVS